LEQPTLESPIALNVYLDWSGVAQVLRRTCRWVIVSTGLMESETTDGIISLTRDLAGPQWAAHF